MIKPLDTGRIAAIDVFRALTMTLMLFVNDIPSLADIPHWLLHAGYSEDMMGFSDTIFPAFLFCMGASVPLAIEHRYRKGDTTLQVVAHVFWRVVALVVMGLFTLNCTGFSDGLSYTAFTVLMVLGFFLSWGTYPKSMKRSVSTAMQAAGAIILVGLILYCDLHGKPFRQSWWGILGLIGWTYAVCAVVYIFTRYRLRYMIGVWVAAVGLSLLSHSSIIPEDYAIGFIQLPFIPSDWTLHALGVSGMLSTLIMLRLARNEATRMRFYTIMLAAGVVFLALGFVCHQYWIISKIQATPSWLFYCLAMFCPLYALLFWQCDACGHTRWATVIRPAGTATLTCYIIPYLWYAMLQELHVHFPEVLCAGWPGLLRSAVYSLLIVQITGIVARAGIKLKV